MNTTPPVSAFPLGKNPKLNELMALVAVAAASSSGNGYDLDEIKRHADHAARLWQEHAAMKASEPYAGQTDVETRFWSIVDRDGLTGLPSDMWVALETLVSRAALLVSNRSGVEAKLRDTLAIIADDNSWRGFSPALIAERMRELARSVLSPTTLEEEG